MSVVDGGKEGNKTHMRQLMNQNIRLFKPALHPIRHTILVFIF